MLGEMQTHLLEPNDSGASWPSGLWTTQEAIDAINDAQYRLLLESCMLITQTTIAAVPAVLRHSLPTDWIATYYAQWRTADNTTHELAKSDGFEADNSAINDWPVERGMPVLYTDGEVPTLTIQIMPASLDAGVIDLAYVALSTTLSNSGVNFTVPDEFVPACKWGALAMLLEKVGRAQDKERAQYCMLRFQEGVAAAILMMEGWA